MIVTGSHPWLLSAIFSQMVAGATTLFLSSNHPAAIELRKMVMLPGFGQTLISLDE
jgi:hypothetical protein